MDTRHTKYNISKSYMNQISYIRMNIDQHHDLTKKRKLTTVRRIQ